MGRAPCCDKVGLKRGRWTAEEDEILRRYIEANGEGSWRSLPKNAGLLRCGKSCRLRWINYLRSDLKRGNISAAEEEIIINIHASLGNRWSLIAGYLPGRTDNEIKNYWNSHLSRKIHSFPRQNPNFIPPPVARIPNRRSGRRTGRPYKKKNKQSDRKSNSTPSVQKKESNGGVNSAVVMPTTTTAEKESLRSTTHNNGGDIIPQSSPLEEGMESLTAAGTEERESKSLMLPINEEIEICGEMGMENWELCLDDIMEDLSEILSLEKEVGIAAMDPGERELSRAKESEPGNAIWNSSESSGAEESGQGNIGNYKMELEKHGEWNLMISPGSSREWDWGQEENTFSWFWDGEDDGKTNFNDGFSFEMDTTDHHHNGHVSWLMS